MDPTVIAQAVDVNRHGTSICAIVSLKSIEEIPGARQFYSR